jgi:hypothetical protein
MATRFENRIDYIDISAYGVGRVDETAFTDQPSENDMQALERGKNKEQRLFSKIRDLGQTSKNIGYSICSLADRQDQKFKLSLGIKKPDQFQDHLVRELWGLT